MARAPEALFRSFLLMAFCQVASIPQWVQQRHDHPAYAILSGFDPDDLPAVGTFYTFMDRLLHRTQKGRSRLRKKVQEAQKAKAEPRSATDASPRRRSFKLSKDGVSLSIPLFRPRWAPADMIK